MLKIIPGQSHGDFRRPSISSHMLYRQNNGREVMSEFSKTIKDDEFEVFQNSRVYDFSTLQLMILINNVQKNYAEANSQSLACTRNTCELHNLFKHLNEITS
jgi:hypothetical protein